MKKRKCAVCEAETDDLLCPKCQRSYDQMLRTEAGTIASVIKWAAKRARAAQIIRLKDMK